MSRIVRLSAENFKRLQAVEITPDGSMVVLSGRNAQGKSSVLDAIWATLAGAAGAKNLDRPIRDGEQRAEVTVELDDLVVTRRWTPGGTSLTVAGTDGRKYSRPQQVLDTLIGKIAFDPLAFAQSKPADQRALLLDALGLTDDLDRLDTRRKDVFTQRTDANREAKRLKARLDALPPTTAPAEPVDVVAIARTLTQVNNATAEIENLRAEVGRIDREIEILQERRSLTIQRGHAATAALAALPDAGSLQAQLNDAEQINEAARIARERAAVEYELTIADQAGAGATATIEAIDVEKRNMLAAAPLPVVGLGVDDDGITLNGVPFSQASAAERLKVSVAMAMAMNPTVRVLCIRDASLLDNDGMAALARFAEQRDFQVWVERVDDTGSVGVVIEDGRVRG